MNFKSLYNTFARHPEGFWIMKLDNAKALYDFVKNNDIKNVLDLGTGIGCSTAIVALALKEKGVDHIIHTIEQDEKCMDIAIDLIPQELKTNIKFHLRDVEVWNTEKIPYLHFSNFPDIPEVEGGYDLIITDGPGPFLDKQGNYIDLENGDVIKMMFEDKIKRGSFLFYDGRLRALGHLERYFGANFYILNASGRCHIVERKNNDVYFGDLKKELIAREGYFHAEATNNKASTSG